jgi:hypothetical protein
MNANFYLTKETLTKWFNGCMLTFIFSMLAIQAQATDYYTLTDDDVVVTNGIIESSSYDPASNSYYIIIPETLDGQTVTGIADGEEDFYLNISGVFYNQGLIEVQLPSTLTYIGDYAFRENALTKITLPSGLVSLGRDAFYNNQITGALTIPNSVKTIGNNAFHTNQIDDIIFEDNSSLIFIASHAFVNNVNGLDFVLPTPQVANFEYWIDWYNDRYQPGETVSATSTFLRAVFPYTLTDEDVVVENGVIASCSYNFDSKFITIPSTLDGQTVTGIADANSQKSGIFYGKTIYEINLPSTMQTIGDFAFISNALDTLVVPSNVKSIGIAAFWRNSLDTVIFANNSQLEIIEEDAFDNNDVWLSIALPSPVKPGHQFDHWEDSEGNIHKGGDIIPDYDLSYTAKFSLEPGTSIITLSGNIDFGLVDQYSQSTKTLTITNTGNASFTVSDIQLPQGFSASWTSGAIAAGENQEVIITFVPNEAKTYSGEIVINSDATSGESSVVVSGEGKPAPRISLSGNLTFGELSLNTSNSKEFTISNTGTASLNVTSIDVPDGYSIDWNSGSIAAGADQTVSVTFTPIENKSYDGTLTVNSNAAPVGNELSISGSGVETVSAIELSGDINFGNVEVNTSASHSMSIKNTGDGALEVTSIEIPPGFATNWSSGSIAAGASKDVTISFNPQEDKDYSGKIIIHSNASSGNNEINISGSGMIVSSLDEGLKNNGIYPNPVVSNLNFTAQGNTKVKIYDIAGNLMLSREFPLPGKQSINLEILKKGIYLLSIEGNNGSPIIEKIIKQ